MQKYNKFWIASIGLVLMGLNTFFGIDFGVDADAVYGFVIMALTAVGVLQVGNK